MSKKLKLSPWHDGSVKPVHVGVYKVYCSCCSQELWSFWNGKFFCKSEWEQINLSKSSPKDSQLKLKKWRGILK